MAPTYAELLKDVRWQRKRLETLEAAAWKCEGCAATDCTLHVHHKRYIKGRAPWEYERRQLAVLCETCHEVATICNERIKELLEVIPAPAAFALLAGFVGYAFSDRRGFSDFLDEDVADEAMIADETAFDAGVVAALVWLGYPVKTAEARKQFLDHRPRDVEKAATEATG